ncbi:PNGase F N-terminal domain-containing protein [Marinifilum flexuosum]|uniref:GLPGLI family protein n=1 Tax=Marinifilum flexuosum TaxID=1117708 RepID=A0A419XB03_9BACT|nr:PNGase F N-terminal domain-containing protein [Marinifilum flexuosum]RKE04749.1 GLPGLI family protein [Marinifilum flexuosum]
MKTRILFLVSILSFSLLVSGAEKKEKGFKISYEQYSHGKLVPNRGVSATVINGIAQLSNSSKVESFFINYKSKNVVKVLKLKDGQFQQITPFSELPTAKETDEKETILGYECKKASFLIFSNRVDVWYTTEAKVSASPSLSVIIDNGLVLKYVVNGNRTILAKSIEKEKGFMEYPAENTPKIDQARYRELIIKSRYRTIPVFDKEQINFQGGITNPKEKILNHTYRFSKGTVIMKKIKMPDLNPEGSVFVKLTNWSNGDAYDRTGCVFTIANNDKNSMLTALKNGKEELPIYIDKKGVEYQGVVSDDNYTVPVELMRFFTSFGVGHFNEKRPINNYNWQDSVVYKQEVTELIPLQEDEVWIGVFIGNYDKGGHKVSLELNYYPPFEETAATEKYIQPLFYTLNVMEASGQNYGRMFKNDTLAVEFTLDENVEDLQLLYTSTGHGGWGNGDEFVPKVNQLLIDDELIFKHVPWRSDCATYRMSNPASGNFGNGLSSSDLSRSNWCPATLTSPYYIPLSNLKAGKHVIKVVIDQGDDEGSSFNHWSVSGILVGNKEISK